MRTASQGRTQSQSASVIGNPTIVKSIDAEIQDTQQKLKTLEAMRSLATGSEPVVRGRGRPARRFQANSATTQTNTGTKRRPGRPKGSKNKPKVVVDNKSDTFANDNSDKSSNE